jgi:hypothetical protein
MIPNIQTYEIDGGWGGGVSSLYPVGITRKENEIKEGGCFKNACIFCRLIFFLALQGYIQIH